LAYLFGVERAGVPAMTSAEDSLVVFISSIAESKAEEGGSCGWEHISTRRGGTTDNEEAVGGVIVVVCLTISAERWYRTRGPGSDSKSNNAA
jgi:hypothetical protein